MKKYSVEQRGRSMIEMLGVLAIVGVLSVAGIAGYSKAMSKYKINKITDQFSTVAANVKTMFASVGRYDGLTGLETAFNLGLLPEDMTKGCNEDGADADSCIVNALNGGVEIKHTATNRAFVIAMDGLSKDACSTLATYDWGGPTGVSYIKVAGESLIDDDFNDTEDTDTENGIVSTTETKAAEAFAAASHCTCHGSNSCSVAVVYF